MDTTFSLVIIGLLFAGLAAGIFVIFFVLMRRQSVSPDIAPTQELSELRGQLSQLTQLSQQQQQGHAEQMAALSKRLEESLAGMSARMGN